MPESRQLPLALLEHKDVYNRHGLFQAMRHEKRPSRGWATADGRFPPDVGRLCPA